MSIATRMAEIQSRLHEATGGKRAVRIAGVTKRQPLDRLQEAIEAGLTLFANNYVQEGQTLREQLKTHPDLEWHFIGHIQSNKAKDLVDYDCIQTLSRIEVARKLSERLGEKTLSIYIEINIGDEASKSGIPPEEVAPFLKSLASFKNLKPIGLMCLPPPLEPIEDRRPFFKHMAELAKQHGLNELSMGTSDDYWLAAEEGATIVRLGTCLFGSRDI